VRLVTQGALALRAGLFADAARAYVEALRLVPGDPESLLGLREAQARLGGAAVVQLDYNRLVQAGAQAFQAGRFADAVKAYQDALQLVPGDPVAGAALRQARYAQAMADGQAAMARRRFADAARLFQEALNNMPGDLAATTSLRQAAALRR
jgi:tetratricopeptide (TPR) repeat protein